MPALRQLYWACDRFAREHDGRAPRQLNSLTKNRRDERWSYLASPDGVAGLYLHPGIRMYKDPNNRNSRVEPPEILALDTRPAIDDGKHWVVDTGGQTTRVTVDEASLAALGLELKPGPKPFAERRHEFAETREYMIYARLMGDAGVVNLPLRNVVTNAEMALQWEPTKRDRAAEGASTMVAAWAKLRAEYFASLVRADSPMLATGCASGSSSMNSICLWKGF